MALTGQGLDLLDSIGSPPFLSYHHGFCSPKIEALSPNLWYIQHIMSGELKYTTFNTDMGWVGILASAKGLLVTTLPQPSSQAALQLLGDSVNRATWSPRPLADLMARLKVYFSGHQATFPDALDLSGATPFQQEVWGVTRLIPYGETRSYLWVANQSKKPGAARAVGQALGRNPLPIIIPCHRVVASNGKLGGFSGGVEMKRRLLYLEAPAGSQ